MGKGVRGEIAWSRVFVVVKKIFKSVMLEGMGLEDCLKNLRKASILIGKEIVPREEGRRKGRQKRKMGSTA